MLKILPFLITIFLFSCTNDDAVSAASGQKEVIVKGDTARLKTVHGDIEISFYPQEAPNTVTRIKELIKQKFYDGIVFHRVIPGFVAQGGDPTGTGMHGSGKKLKAEFNKHKHIPGAIAMARAQDPNSADSQFYITLGTHPHLDNSYTVFAHVTKGMEVAKKIVQGDKIISFTLE